MIAGEGRDQAVRRGMDSTGIGFAGIDGAWWLPAAEPFPLPLGCRREIDRIGSAVFTLFDVVNKLLLPGVCPELAALVAYKVPAHLLQWQRSDPVLALRPDFQLQPISAGEYQPVITELEICPSAQGFAHAMQVGYGLEQDLVGSFARLLDGRELLIAGTARWSEFLFEQLAFCRALTEAGASARVWYDRPIEQIASEVWQGKRWQPPMFGIQERPLKWEEDIVGRISAANLDHFLLPDASGLPQDMGDRVVFRFGYLDCFDNAVLDLFESWRQQGAFFLNPANFALDSKVLMAALQLPPVREQIRQTDRSTLEVLDRSIPETFLLRKASVERLMAAKDDWVLKFAGFDGGDQAWGGRSLQIGHLVDSSSWKRMLLEMEALPWPVVVQRLVPTLVGDVEYAGDGFQRRLLHRAHARLRAFFIRHAAGAESAGIHVTFRGGTMQVSEGSDSVQAPAIFV